MFHGRSRARTGNLWACRADLRRACCRCLCCGRASSDRYARLIDLALLAAVVVPTLPVTLYLLFFLWISYRLLPSLPLPQWVPGWAHAFFGKVGSGVLDETGAGYDARDDGVADGESDDDCDRALRLELETPNMPWCFPFAFEPACIRFYGRDNRPCPTRKPTPEYFDPRKPTLLYVHGIEPGTTVRGFRETFVTPTGVETVFPRVPTGNLWLDRGYNIAIFYWNQFSDDERPAVEKKIYVGGPMSFVCKTRGSSRVGRRDGDAQWPSDQQQHRLVRRLTQSSDEARARFARGSNSMSRDGRVDHEFAAEDDDGPSIAEQLGNEIARYFGRGGGEDPDVQPCAGVRIVGHSMGSQLVLEALRRLMVYGEKEAVDGDKRASVARARAAVEAVAREKIVLLDPFFGKTVHPFPPFFGKSCAGERASENLGVIHGWRGYAGSRGGDKIALETHVTSIIGEGWLGSYPRELRTLTLHRDVPLPDVSWLDIKQRHCIAHHYYMCKILEEQEEALSEEVEAQREKKN